VIRARIHSVYLSCTASLLLTTAILHQQAHLPLSRTPHLLGWWPVLSLDILRIQLLTATLFAGPLYERVLASGRWRAHITGRPLLAELRGLAGWRNYVVGPVSEELLFRTLLVPLGLLAAAADDSPAKTVLLTPLFFAVAHVHHLYEVRLAQPRVPLAVAVAQTLLQLAYTTLFGWFASFVFVRTGSAVGVMLAHSFCNWMGLPRVWGRLDGLEGKAGEGERMGVLRARSGSFVRTRSGLRRDQVDGGRAKSRRDGKGKEIRELHVAWTVVYYLLLVAGAVGFSFGLWPLTESENALARF